MPFASRTPDYNATYRVVTVNPEDPDWVNLLKPVYTSDIHRACSTAWARALTHQNQRTCVIDNRGPHGTIRWDTHDEPRRCTCDA